MLGPLSDSIKPLATPKNITALLAIFILFVGAFRVLGSKIRTSSSERKTLDGHFYNWSSSTAMARSAPSCGVGRRSLQTRLARAGRVSLVCRG